MTQIGLDHIRAQLGSAGAVRDIGRVASIGQGTIQARGLSGIAAVGDRVVIRPHDGGAAVRGEVIGLTRRLAHILPDTPPEGINLNDRVMHLGPVSVAPDESWIGRVIDPMGNPLDGTPLLRGLRARSIMSEAPNPTERRALGRRVETGLSIFNTMLPIVRGQRIGIFSGSGVGKSTLLAQLARGVDADIVVIAMIGERGREVRHFVERVLGPKGMARAIVVSATADRSAAERRRAGLTAMSIAEHFREQGRHVLLLMDSLTRLADAHREVALAAGEAGTLRGYPPSVGALLSALCERAGPGPETEGDITAILNVLVAGSDMDEPIADITRGVLDGHIVLDREIAERGRFPAIDVLRSVSRSLPDAASDAENALIARARELLGAFARAELMIQSGLYQAGSDDQIDAAVAAWPALDAFVARSEHENTEASFAALAECLSTDGPEDPRAGGMPG